MCDTKVGAEVYFRSLWPENFLTARKRKTESYGITMGGLSGITGLEDPLGNKTDTLYVPPVCSHSTSGEKRRYSSI